MALRRAHVAAVGLVVAISAFMAFRPFSPPLTGDYPIDAAPTIHALLDGDVARAFDVQPLMGSFSILLRMPFAALALLGDGGVLLTYRLGAFPCVLVAGLLGLYVAREMHKRGQSPVACVALVALLLVNPMTDFVLDEGHPEELLGAALCIAAVLAAVRDRPMLAAVMLGLGLATKQWALIAVAPVLVALAGDRLKTLLVAGGIAAALTLPLLIADPAGFDRTVETAQGAGSTEVRPYTVWRLVASPSDRPGLGEIDRELIGHALPEAVTPVSHAAIVLLPIPLTLLFWRRRSGFAREDALLLLAFLFLLRCVLDPVDGPYYHVPFLFTLATWEGLRRRGIPVGSIMVSALLILSLHHGVENSIWVVDTGVGTVVPVHVFYLAWALPLTAWLALRLYAPRVLADLGTALRSLAARARGPERSPAGTRP